MSKTGKKVPNGHWKSWTNIETALLELSRSHHGLIPSHKGFVDAGLLGLLMSLHWWGGLEEVRKRMGLSGLKFCRPCNTVKKIEEFRIKKSVKGPHRSTICQNCDSEAVSVYRRSTWPGRAAELARRVRERAMALGREHDLDKQWILDRLIANEFKCEVTDLQLEMPNGTDGVGFANRYGVSIDRIDSSKGYTKDNVRMVTNRINIALGDLSDDQFEPFAIGFLTKRGFVVSKQNK